MKQPAAGALLVLGISLGPAVFTEARERVIVREDGIKFFVSRYEGKTKLYGVRFSTSATGTSDFRLKEDGKVDSFKADTESYVVRYRANGSLRKVIRKDSGARMLVTEDDLEDYMEDAEEGAAGLAHRSLYACDDCEEKWNVVCSEGISTVCDLSGYSSLGTKGAEAVEVMCDSLGSACETVSAEEVCDGECIDGACNPNPCLNGGSCAIDGGGGHVCSCPSGFGGMACQLSTGSLASFYIELEFLGTWTAARKKVFRSAAERWAEVITHVPCGGDSQDPPGRLLISATLEAIDGQDGTLGFAGPDYVWNACPTISLLGSMTFDIDDIDALEAENSFEGVVLHEMGHVIGVGTLWGSCSSCDRNRSPKWKCPAAAAVYNDLKGDPDGTDTTIIELNGGRGTRCGHFDEDTFEDELMTGYVNEGFMPLSKLTAASLDDTGYIVDPNMADPYTLPALRALSRSAPEKRRIVLEDIVVGATIYLVDENGDVTGEMEGIKMQF